jgi:hypothetical protein
MRVNMSRRPKTAGLCNVSAFCGERERKRASAATDAFGRCDGLLGSSRDQLERGETSTALAIAASDSKSVADVDTTALRR